MEGGFSLLGENPSLVNVTSRITQRVAGQKETNPDDLPLLYNVIDPDSLQSFVESAPDEALIQFEYHGCDVTLLGDGTAKVEEITDEPLIQ